MVHTQNFDRTPRNEMMVAWARCVTLVAVGLLAGAVDAQEPVRDYEKLGILMDVSAEMGFLVPQVRKEIRLLNGELFAASREPLAYREIDGCAIDKKGSLGTPASRNAVYALEALIEEDEVDGILWITSLRGEETGFEKDELTKLFPAASGGTGKGGEAGGGKPTQLIVHQIWQDQVQSGYRGIGAEDHLDQLLAKGLGREWVEVIGNSGGYLMRSWWMPDFEAARYFAFPFRITHSALLRKLDVRELTQQYHATWTSRLRMRYGLEFSRPWESWPITVEGRRWCGETTLVPFLKAAASPGKDDPPHWQIVYRQMCGRDSIEQDVAMIKADKLGVLFGFGYLERDLASLKNAGNRRLNARQHYMASLVRIGNEAKAYAESQQGKNDLVCEMEYLALRRGRQEAAASELYARRMAGMVREKGVDAIYFFTNGFTGSGNYGEFGIDEELMAKAIREAGVRLYVRVPFEFGVAPMKLQKLAIASGGGVFFGPSDDPDFDMARPEGEWPDPSEP